MGKNLIQQRRGKGSPGFRAPSFRYAGKAKHPKAQEKDSAGYIVEILHSAGHSSPLMVVEYNEEYNLTIAPEGVKVGDKISYCTESEMAPGSVLPLSDIPEGTPVFNVEAIPGDGGKFVRSSGASARVISKTNDKVIIRLPSKKNKEFSGKCLATIGIAAGAGRTEKPLLKAGNKFYKMRAKNKLWPKVRGVAMNAVAHPFGGKSTHSKGRPTQSPRNAPPGRKVGKIAPSRTGRKNR